MARRTAPTGGATHSAAPPSWATSARAATRLRGWATRRDRTSHRTGMAPSTRPSLSSRRRRRAICGWRTRSTWARMPRRASNRPTDEQSCRAHDLSRHMRCVLSHHHRRHHHHACSRMPRGAYAGHRYADDAPPFDPRNAARYVRLMQFGVWSPVFRPQASTLHGGRLSWRRHRWPWLAPQAASEGLGLPHCPCEKRHSDATERLWPWHPRPHQQSSIPAASMAIVMQARRWQHGHARLELPRASRNHPC